MTIDQSDPFQLSREQSWLKTSYRSWPEQLLGLGIFLVVSFGFEILHRWFFSFSGESEWFRDLKQAPWSFAGWAVSPIGTLSLVAMSLSMWGLWRRRSLKTLKPELSLYLSILVLMFLWSFSFFRLQELLLGLVALLLAWCTLLVTGLLFWKKDRFACQLLVIPFFWIFYLASLTMVICTSGAG
ncbi:MAG: tryptophan-rich sensory protein [Verrucomicrobia bacterium]|nr:tryptophan-rich sensory protein [Verrucomicrobiota bacterium]